MAAKVLIILLITVASIIENLAYECPNQTFMNKHTCLRSDDISKCAANSNHFRRRRDYAKTGDVTLFIRDGSLFVKEYDQNGDECVSHNIPRYCCKRIPNQKWDCKRDGEGNAAHNAKSGHLLTMCVRK